MDTPQSITLFAFRYRDERTGNWRDARYKITPEEAHERYGEGNYELIPGTQETRTPIVGNLRGSR